MSFFGEKSEEKKQKPEEKRTWQQSLVLDLKDLIYVLAVFMLVYMLFFRVVVVVGSSMYDTLHDGDRLLLISSTFYTEPKQGDIIVASKKSFSNGDCIVKRVIATEGQTVNIDYEKGLVYVDDVPLEEAYILEFMTATSYSSVQFPLTVEEGHVFVMGDNRNNSSDSRHPQIGQIDQREILGKAVFLLAPADDGSANPMDRFGVIE